MEKIKISVIVPVYNVEDYIRKCLDSLINQTYKNLEIIVVDDGSQDSSGKICDEYANKDQRIHVIHKANGGLVSARKSGILLATGEYSTYVDSDDWIDENAFEELVDLLIIYHPDILAYGFIKEYYDFTIKREELLQEGYYDRRRFLIESNKIITHNHFFCQMLHFSACSKIYKTNLVKECQLEVNDEIRIGEDMAVVFQCMMKMQSLFIIKKCYYHYRVNEKSICNNRGEDEYQRYLKLVKHLSEMKSNFKEWSIDYENYFVQIIFYYLILCAVEYCFIEKSELLLFPKVKKNSNIIIYGKGVFANSLANTIKQLNFCNIICCVDKIDATHIKLIDEEYYDYIIIAITEYSAVQTSINLLKTLEINMTKVLSIQKEDLCIEKLPKDVQVLIK